MLDFVFIEDIEVDVDMLVPKRWDAATTISGLREATGIIEAADWRRLMRKINIFHRI